MRIYVRLRSRYNPACRGDLTFVDVQSVGRTTPDHIRNLVKQKVPSCKIDELFYLDRATGIYYSLAADRTVDYYNLPDNCILETTSNPLWVAAVYTRMAQRDKEAADNPENGRLVNGHEKSHIMRATALLVLLNSDKSVDKQPDTFLEFDDMYEYLRHRRKKSCYMSEGTQGIIKEMKQEYLNECCGRNEDPIGLFVHRQAIKLGFRSDDKEWVYWSDAPVDYGNEKAIPNKASGRPRKQQQQCLICQDCDDNPATIYCPTCNDGMLLCQDCDERLHHGARMRQHQRTDAANAPQHVKKAQQETKYLPIPYRAPFAMLVALHRALPDKRSLSIEELKSQAQAFTDTDLFDKGKLFGGFDAMDNTLLKKGIIQKEASKNPRFHLLDGGRELARKCSEFDQAFVNLCTRMSVPALTSVNEEGFTCAGRRVCLIVDQEEKNKERLIDIMGAKGVPVQVRKLPAGDYLWILLPENHDDQDNEPRPEEELVLPHLVERKTWDDFGQTVRTPRFHNQVSKMIWSLIRDLFYLVEGSINDMRNKPAPEQQRYLENLLEELQLKDEFFVCYAGSWLKTSEWLYNLTRISSAMHNSQEAIDVLMTYREFCTNVQNQQLARDSFGNFHQRLNKNDAVITVWDSGKFIQLILNEQRDVLPLSYTIHDELNLEWKSNPTFRPSRQLLIVEGLKQYNANRDKVLKNALKHHITSKNVSADVVVEDRLSNDVDSCIKYDVISYWLLYIQLYSGALLRRTESQEDTERIAGYFEALRSDARNAPIQPLIEDNNDKTRDLDDNKNPNMIGYTAYLDHGLPLQQDVDEEELLRRAIAESLKEANVNIKTEPGLLDPDPGTRHSYSSIDRGNKKPKVATGLEYHPEDYDLKKALELSKAEHTHGSLSATQKHKGKLTIIRVENNDSDFSPVREEEDDELKRALEISKNEFTHPSSVSNFSELEGKPEPRHASAFGGLSDDNISYDRNLLRALRISKIESTQFSSPTSNSIESDKKPERKSKGTYNRLVENNNIYDYDLKRALEASRTQQHTDDSVSILNDYEADLISISDNTFSGAKPRDTFGKLLDNNAKGNDWTSEDYDLRRALDISRTEHTFNTSSISMPYELDTDCKLERSYSGPATITRPNQTRKRVAVISLDDEEEEEGETYENEDDDMKLAIRQSLLEQSVNDDKSKPYFSSPPSGSKQFKRSTSTPSWKDDSFVFFPEECRSSSPSCGSSNRFGSPDMKSMNSSSTAMSGLSSMSVRPGVNCGIRCKTCREYGHRTGQRICPKYFSDEEVRKRKERAEKAAEKRRQKQEEEERAMQQNIALVAAQRREYEDRIREINNQRQQVNASCDQMENRFHDMIAPLRELENSLLNRIPKKRQKKK